MNPDEVSRQVNRFRDITYQLKIEVVSIVQPSLLLWSFATPIRKEMAIDLLPS